MTLMTPNGPKMAKNDPKLPQNPKTPKPQNPKWQMAWFCIKFKFKIGKMETNQLVNKQAMCGTFQTLSENFQLTDADNNEMELSELENSAFASV